MAIRGLAADEKNWFVCRDDPGKRDTLEESREAGATIFHFTSIPGKIMAQLNDATQVAEVKADMQSQTFHNRGSQKNYDAARYGLIGWENYPDEQDNAIPFEREQAMGIGGTFYPVVSDATMNRMKLATINEVGGYIFNKNSLQDDERKKLEGLFSRFDGSDTSNVANAMDGSDENEDVSDQQNTTDGTRILPGLPTNEPEKSTGPKSGTGKTPQRKRGKTSAPGG